MKQKTIFLLTAVALLAITGSALALQQQAKSPVYLYLHNAETGNCDIKDSNFYYTPVAPGTINSFPILANLGGEGNSCDTIYVQVEK